MASTSFGVCKTFRNSNSNKFIYLFLILSSLLLAYFSWRFIERPFRHKSLIVKEYLILFHSDWCFYLLFRFLWPQKEGDLGQLSNKQTILLDFYENKTPDWNYIKRKILIINFVLNVISITMKDIDQEI